MRFSILRWLKRTPKNVFPNARHVIVPAFVVGGRQYYRFDDHMNVPYERALACLPFYRELECNVDGEFLKAHLLAVRKALTGTTIDIFRINALNEQLLQRLDLPKDPELMYKLASVVFFDESEKPETYEYAYGQKKIDFWKEQIGLKDFFLQTPIVELIPYLKFAGENLETFSEMIQDVNAHQSATLSAS